MPSRASTSFLRKVKLIATYPVRSYVSMPFRAYISFLLQYDKEQDAYERIEVSMPSRAYTSFLLSVAYGYKIIGALLCQCPLGLIPHFYGTPSKT